MQIWLDTIDFRLIADAVQRGVIAGVTTNPSILSCSENVSDTLKTLLEIQPGPLAVQVVSNNPGEMIEEGRSLFNISSRIIIKVPVTQGGLIAINQLRREKIPVMGTGVIYVAQALLASNLEATYVALYFSRIINEVGEACATLKAIVDMYRINQSKTKILVASIKRLDHLLFCASLGIDAVTIKAELYETLIAESSIVQSFSQKFSQDWKQAYGNSSIKQTLSFLS